MSDYIDEMVSENRKIEMERLQRELSGAYVEISHQKGEIERLKSVVLSQNQSIDRLNSLVCGDAELVTKIEWAKETNSQLLAEIARLKSNRWRAFSDQELRAIYSDNLGSLDEEIAEEMYARGVWKRQISLEE